MTRTLITFALTIPPGLALGYTIARWIVSWGKP